MSRILFYSPFNQRSRDTESLMIAFKKQGHTVFSLSQQEGFVINDFLNSHGIVATSYVIPGRRGGWRYFLRHLIYFIRFCWRFDVDVVFSHLEPANFVAAVGQYFVRPKTYLCRHHIDEGSLYKFDKDLYYKITYRLARHIIVVSAQAKEYMIRNENIPASKIIHINLAYDFSLYPPPDAIEVRRLQASYAADVLLLAACRLTEHKRPGDAIHTLKKLVDKGINAKLILLGKGEMHDDLLELTRQLGIERIVFMPGYVNNVMDYMAAADFFLHPSILDSSCVAVKEAGLAELPVIVCKGIGDFDEYLEDAKNGFLVNRETFTDEAAEIILNYRSDSVKLQSIGSNLRQSVLHNFSIENIIVRYESLLKN